VAVIPAAGENIREPSPGTQGPTVIYATTTLKCRNGDSHEISTGTDKGSCTVTPGKKAECLDAPGGGGASATCEAGCVSTSGPASCTTKSASLETPPGSPKPPAPRGKPGVAVIPPAGKSIVDRGSILDSGPGFGSQGPAAATGAPLSPGRGSAPPPGQIK
jgi:hypothetical protein